MSSKRHKKGKNRNNRNNNHFVWKGDMAKIKTIHDYIRYWKPKSDICKICGKVGKTELSNIDHRYSRHINNYRWLCRMCHIEYDKKEGLS